MTPRHSLLVLCLLAMLAGAHGRTMTITAYCQTGRTATGSRPVQGICAGPRLWLRRWVYIKGLGKYYVADVCPKPGVIDIWHPVRRRCMQFGKQRRDVQLLPR